MSSAIVRSTLRTALRPRLNQAPTRSFSSGASVEEEAREASKWEKITYLGIVACSVLAFVNLSKGHPHFEEPLRIRTCTFVTRSSHGDLMASLK